MSVTPTFFRQVFAFWLAYQFLVTEIVPANGGYEKIKGGRETPAGRFTYMVSLQDEKEHHRCGAVLISGEWVLTAAHCVDPDAPNTLGSSPIIVLGDHDVNDDSDNDGIQKMRPVAVVIHPLYNPHNVRGGSDLALLKLPKRSKLAAIPKADPLYKLQGKQPMALGWGNEGEDEPREGPLKMADLTLVKFDSCKNSWEELKQSMICGYSGVANICDGDSGGPLIIPHGPSFDLGQGNPTLDLLVGIVSFGPFDCSTNEQPTVFTSIASFSKWINGVISGNPDFYRVEEPNTESAGGASTDVQSNAEFVRLKGLRKYFMGASEDELNRALYRDIGMNRTKDIKVLLELGANTEAEVFGSTPLIKAAREGSLQDLKVLLKTGADVNIRDSKDNTPLHVAAQEKKLIIVKELLKNGANINATGHWGNTPLHFASAEGHLRIVQELVKRGADIHVKDLDGNTALHKACYSGHLEIVKELLKFGAYRDAENNARNSPLHMASEQGHLDIVKELLRSKAYVDAKNNFGDTPLYLAGRRGHIEIAKVLIQGGATIKDENGNTPKAVQDWAVEPFPKNDKELKKALKKDIPKNDRDAALAARVVPLFLLQILFTLVLF